jgi:CBS domain-containing protein
LAGHSAGALWKGLGCDADQVVFDEVMTTVREIMSRQLVTIGPSATLLEAARVMSAGHVGSVLVLEAGSLVGIFTERDMLRALAESSKADEARVSAVSKWMTRDPVTVGPDEPAAEALDTMLFGGFRHLPVTESEAVRGMVSMRDLARNVTTG